MNLSRSALKRIHWLVGTVTAPLRPGNVVLFHLARSGSSVLADLMNQNPKVLWGGEIFHGFPGQREAAMAKLKRCQAYAGHRFYGFDAQLYQIRRIGYEFPEFVTELKGHGVTHFAMLRRRNLVRLVVSALNARQSGVWQNKGRAGGDRKGIEIDIDHAMLQFLDSDQEREAVLREKGDHDVSLLGWLGYLEEGYESLAATLASERSLFLDFEGDIEADPGRAYRKFCDFLQIPLAKVAPRLSRTTPFELADIVSNFDELGARLAGTRYEWMLAK